MKSIFSFILIAVFSILFYEKAKELGFVNVNKVEELVSKNLGGGDSNQVETKEVVHHSQEAIDYFNTICRGSEFASGNEISKWDTDVKVFVKGEKPTYLMSELKSIVAELNGYINPINIDFVSSESDANFTVYFCEGDEYVAEEPYAADFVSTNWGLFVVYGGSSISKATMYVDIVRCEDINGQKHLLREEFTQALGLKKDSYDYQESMFYQGWTTTTEYAPIDVEIIKMLYNE